jgi:hypothetical protein
MQRAGLAPGREVNRCVPYLLIFIVLAIPLTGLAQPFTPLGVNEKLRFHLNKSVSPMAFIGDAAYAGLLHEVDTPAEWGQGGSGYARRFASTAASSGIHSALAFGLDAGLHEDPRYLPSGTGGFWRRTGHALRGTILTRTDRGTETLSFWRLGSAYGAAYLSNQWYPGRLNTIGLGFTQGSLQLGFDFSSNLAAEFWPDLKRIVLRRKP